MYSAEQYDILPIMHSDSMHTQVSVACMTVHLKIHMEIMSCHVCTHIA